MAQYKTNPWTVILTVIITAIIVGGGFYFWQGQKEIVTSPVIEEDKDTVTVLLKDEENGVMFTTNSKCKDYFEIKFDEVALDYKVYLPGSKQWGESHALVYAIYNQEELDKIDTDTPSGAPTILFELDSGLLLTRWDPQDWPLDIPDYCKVTPEKL